MIYNPSPIPDSSPSDAGSTVGVVVPKIVLDFVQSTAAGNRLPIRFVLKTKPFVLEAQYFHDLRDRANMDAFNARVRFAVTTDGLDLLVSLNHADLAILQDEFGDIDNLGISMADLVEADKISI